MAHALPGSIALEYFVSVTPLVSEAKRSVNRFAVDAGNCIIVIVWSADTDGGRVVKREHGLGLSGQNSLTANKLLDMQVVICHFLSVVNHAGDCHHSLKGDLRGGCEPPPLWPYHAERVAAPGGPRWRGTAQVIRVSTFLPHLPSQMARHHSRWLVKKEEVDDLSG